MQNHSLTLPKTITSHTVLDEIISVRKDRLLYANKHEQDYFVVTSSAESVVVVASSTDGKILVTKEYRHPTTKVVLGLPGGMVNHNEPILEAASRELLEETGCVATTFTVLGSCYPLPGLLAQKMYIVHAKDAVMQGPSDLEAGETLESTFLSQEQIKEHLRYGLDVDGVFCTALYFYSLFAP